MDKRKQSLEEDIQSDVSFRDKKATSNGPVNHRESRDSTNFDMPKMQPDIPVDIAGTLHKKGRRLKTWKQRYFEVQGTNMYYFKNEKAKQSNDCMGYIDLTKLYYVGKSQAASFGASFELQTMGRVHLLAARNESDMNEWITAIKSKMSRDAKTRAKKGSRSDINAVFDIKRERRATIKLNRSSPTSTNKTRITTPTTINEDEPAAVPSITSSQSFPEFSTHKVSPQLGPSPSDYQISDIINKEEEEEHRELPITQQIQPLPSNTTNTTTASTTAGVSQLQDDSNDVFYNSSLNVPLNEPTSPVDVELPPFMSSTLPAHADISPLDEPLPVSPLPVSPLEDMILPPSLDDMSPMSPLEPLPSFSVDNLPPPLIDPLVPIPTSPSFDEPLPTSPFDDLPPTSPLDPLPTSPFDDLPPTSPLDPLPMSPFDGTTSPFDGPMSPFDGTTSPFDGPTSPFDGPMSPLDDILPPPLEGSEYELPNLTSNTSQYNGHLLADLPSPDDISLPSLQFPPPPPTITDPPDIEKLREFLNRDDPSLNIQYDSNLLPPMPQPWLKENNSIDQLRSFLDVCI